MTTESTVPISSQRSAIGMVAELASQFPDLPAAYITIHRPFQDLPLEVSLNIPTPSGFEQWRAALGIEPDTVHLYPYGANSYVTGSIRHDGIDIQISAHGILLTQEQLSAPRARDEVSV